METADDVERVLMEDVGERDGAGVGAGGGGSTWGGGGAGGIAATSTAAVIGPRRCDGAGLAAVGVRQGVATSAG